MSRVFEYPSAASSYPSAILSVAPLKTTIASAFLGDPPSRMMKWKVTSSAETRTATAKARSRKSLFSVEF